MIFAEHDVQEGRPLAAEWAGGDALGEFCERVGALTRRPWRTFPFRHTQSPETARATGVSLGTG
ncbi:hypothetical protein AB0L53_49890 [Nonomuraea sp. NPDC052129]|uniref:hypothetical protein n=1 Tax=Nonomuraea sp. NPDC052129 TaxID=3154651 RepID=UPI003415A35E